MTRDDVVDGLLARMTLDELVGQLVMPANLDPADAADAALLAAGGVGATLLASGATAGNVRDEGVTRARVDALQRAAGPSRLGIPLLVGRDVIHGHRTVFPIPLGLAASFDAALVEGVFAAAAREALADGIGWTFAPMIDVVDDARWGRVAESFGESTLLTSRLGAAAVRGVQEAGIAACAKHFVGYGLSRGGRDYAAVEVGERTLRQRLLPPFRAAVDAGALSVMAAFSAVDGVPMHAHRDLIRGVLKGEWGFDGVVVADWGAVGELVAHGVAADLRDAARLAIEAGVDLDMASGAYAAHLVGLVETGEVDRALVVEAARRVLRMKSRLGLFDAASPLLPGSAPDAPSRATALARRAAETALVVVKGSPLVTAADAPLLLAGPFVDERASLYGTWVLDGDPAEPATIAEAVTAACAAHALPAPVVDDGLFADRLLRRAREAETVVAVVGEHALRSGEDSAIGDVGLPAGQLEVLRALRAVSRRLVVVVLTGRPLALAEVEGFADALVVAWHPGVEGAAAIAGLLLDAAAPSGRLPMAMPRSAGHLPLASSELPSGRPQAVDPRGLTRYADEPGAPWAAFGAGRSVLAPGLLTGPASVVAGSAVELVLTIANPSERAVRESVLLLQRAGVSEISRPVQELADARILELAAGATTEVRFRVGPEVLGVTGRDGVVRVRPGTARFWIDGAPEASVDVALVSPRE